MANWQTKPLGAVCRLVNRGISPVYLDNSGVVVLNQKCVRDHTINFDFGRRHDAAAKKVPIDRFLCAGDVLVNSTGTGTLGRVAQLRDEPPEPTTVDSHVTIVRPVEELLYPDFFGYALIAIESQIQQGGEGCGGQTELSRAKLANDYHISYPTDLNEQRRLVDILDEAFEGISTAVANTEKNLASARELFESYLNSIFTQKGDGWVTEQLGTIVKFIDYRGKTPPKREEGIRLITAKNVKMGYIQRTPEEFIDPSAYKAWMTRGFPQKGDVLFTTEAPLGNVAQLDTDETVVIGQRLITFQADQNILDHSFLKFALMSIPVQKEIFARGTGATVLGIKASLLKQVLIYFPKKTTEQIRIAAQIKEVMEIGRRLEVIYQQKLESLSDLKQAILAEAFAGKLTTRAIEAMQEAAE